MYQKIYGTQVIKLRILNGHFMVLEIFFWHIGIKEVMESDVTMYQTIYGTQVIKKRILNGHFIVLEFSFGI